MRRADHAPELLDAPHHDRAELEQSLDQVAEVNRLLGGQRAVLRTLRRLAPDSGTWRILDVGTGSADIPIAIVRHARTLSRNPDIDIAITASDLHPQMREIARDRTRGHESICITDADALSLPFADGSFDTVLLSLTLHHFERPDQIRALREAARVARGSVVVNELERCLPNYAGARLLAWTRWRGNRLTRHDGPLSVLRAFTMGELREIAGEAGLHVRQLQRFFFFRLVLEARRR